MSYVAYVTKIFVREHPNADRLQLGTCMGNQVVVGKEIKNGELGVFFPPDGQLSEEFCKEHDLIAHVDPDTGQRTGGFFGQSRRVKSQRFRGEKSDGYWCPLSMFEFTGYDISLLEENDEFSELNGIPICNKYYTPYTLKAMKSSMSGRRKEVKCFPEIPEYDNFRFAVGGIPKGALIYISEKCHGTSGRYAHVLDEYEIPLSPAKKFLNKCFLTKFKPEERKEYRYFTGTRRTILEKREGDGYYGNDQFRINAVAEISLHKSEIFYFELVGYTTNNIPIMSNQDTTKLKDKEIQKRYGDVMRYTYGCEQGQCRMFVYRITTVNEDGQEIDLPWNYVTRRCRELGLTTVSLLTEPFIYDGNQENLRELVESLTEGESTIDPSHIREGVVLRVESEYGMLYIKNKSFTFFVLEGVYKDNDTYVDLEEIS